MKGSSKAALGVGATIGAGGTILAIVLIILGILLSLTVIGAIIGIPLIIIGVLIMTGAIGTSTLIGSAVAIDESLDEHRRSRKREVDVECPECRNSFLLSLDNKEYVDYVKGKDINCECPECYSGLKVSY